MKTYIFLNPFFGQYSNYKKPKSWHLLAKRAKKQLLKIDILSKDVPIFANKDQLPFFYKKNTGSKRVNFKIIKNIDQKIRYRNSLGCSWQIYFITQKLCLR